MTMARAIVRLNWTRKKSVKAQGQARQAWITGAKEWDLQREEILHQLGTLSRGDVG
jgi:ethanolamine utilization cobalamin adenosyltransferase